MYRLLCCLLATPTTSIVQGATFFKVCNAYVIQGARGSSAKQSKARQLYKRQGGRASFSCLGGLPSPPPLSLPGSSRANLLCQSRVSGFTRPPSRAQHVLYLQTDTVAFFTFSLPFFLPPSFPHSSGAPTNLFYQRWAHHKTPLKDPPMPICKSMDFCATLR